MESLSLAYLETAAAVADALESALGATMTGMIPANRQDGVRCGTVSWSRPSAWRKGRNVLRGVEYGTHRYVIASNGVAALDSGRYNLPHDLSIRDLGQRAQH